MQDVSCAGGESLEDFYNMTLRSRGDSCMQTLHNNRSVTCATCRTRPSIRAVHLYKAVQPSFHPQGVRVRVVPLGGHLFILAGRCGRLGAWALYSSI